MRNPKSFLAIIISGLMMCILCACGAKTAATGTEYDASADESAEAVDNSANPMAGQKRRIIIDTDTGADDASAIILAASYPDVEILGVTVLVGNVDLEQSTKNALMALEIAGCDAPVYKGADATFDGTSKIAFSVFGEDGMGEAGLINPQRTATEGEAVDFILETVKAYPGEVEIVALGPATNIANAIAKDPGTMKDVKMIWSMGTTGLGPGNASPVAEFNVYADVLAYKEMLDSGISITVIGLDMCDDEAQWTDEQFIELAKSGKTGDFVAKSFGKIRDFYKANGSETVMNCDALAMTSVLVPGFMQEKIHTHASCISDEGETYGQVIFYKEGFTYDVAQNDFVYNVDLVTKVKKQDYFNTYMDIIERR